MPIAIFWGYSHDEAHASEQIDCEVVTGLEEAVQKILTVVEPDREPAALADHPDANKPALRSGTKILRRHASRRLRDSSAMKADPIG